MRSLECNYRQLMESKKDEKPLGLLREGSFGKVREIIKNGERIAIKYVRIEEKNKRVEIERKISEMVKDVCIETQHLVKVLEVDTVYDKEQEATLRIHMEVVKRVCLSI